MVDYLATSNTIKYKPLMCLEYIANCCSHKQIIVNLSGGLCKKFLLGGFLKHGPFCTVAQSKNFYSVCIAHVCEGFLTQLYKINVKIALYLCALAKP